MADTEIIKQIATLNEQMKAAFKRIDEQKQLSDSLHALAISVERQTSELTHQRKELTALRADVDEIKDKPSRRWDLIISGIISAVVAAVMVVVLRQK